ncbi:DUF429 domain-containing protein [Williamsia sterculiae]|uniref:DUF429 domain-containing protein n=1 Tax=Williamsia sterculiae TaxID=1344003 RepID=A0A1N7DMK4_9NOCA|nr:DUF429 domain-containing protein [Williamsia sterculiae]SIR77089.1 Protein of unknown function [Williamsia sterculiae]
MVLTAGVDLAAAPDKTAVVLIAWHDDGTATVEELVTPADDDAVLRVVGHADRCGIDAPIGWPSAFVDFVTRHRRHRTPAGLRLDDRANRRSLAYRITDEQIRLRTGLIPLSVSADRIAHVAFRSAGLLAELEIRGFHTDRVDGFAVEAYPAAALHTWGLTSRGYKGADKADARSALIDDLTTRAPWLRLGDHRAACLHSDDAADAVITAMIARAVALGLTSWPDDELAETARVEGWIHVPTGSLDDLVGR